MADPTPETIDRLRRQTGCGLSQCAWALRVTHTEEQAAGVLRLRGIAINTREGFPTQLEKFLRDITPEEATDG